MDREEISEEQRYAMDGELNRHVTDEPAYGRPAMAAAAGDQLDEVRGGLANAGVPAWLVAVLAPLIQRLLANWQPGQVLAYLLERLGR